MWRIQAGFNDSYYSYSYYYYYYWAHGRDQHRQTTGRQDVRRYSPERRCGLINGRQKTLKFPTVVRV